MGSEGRGLGFKHHHPQQPHWLGVAGHFASSPELCDKGSGIKTFLE